MGYIYSNQQRETEEHALPNVEVFQARPIVIECSQCGNTTAPWDGQYDKHSLECPICGVEASAGRFARASTGNWWWWACFPGCMPDGEPFGPFETEAEAIANAQETQ